MPLTLNYRHASPSHLALPDLSFFPSFFSSYLSEVAWSRIRLAESIRRKQREFMLKGKSLSPWKSVNIKKTNERTLSVRFVPGDLPAKKLLFPSAKLQNTVAAKLLETCHKSEFELFVY